MIVTKTEIPDVLIIEPKLFGDQRGFFLETFQVERYQSHGIKGPFVQDNLSRSAHGVLRGLHLQKPNTQGKLVSVLDRFKPNIEPIWLVYPQTRHLTPTERAFVDLMAAQFRSRPPGRTVAT